MENKYEIVIDVKEKDEKERKKMRNTMETVKKECAVDYNALGITESTSKDEQIDILKDYIGALSFELMMVYKHLYRYQDYVNNYMA